MDLSGLSSFGSAVYPGFVQGQSNQAVVGQQQEAAKQARLKTEEMLADREATVAIGNFAASLGMTPPGQASPVAPPAAPPQPPPLATTSAGSPVMPPGQPGMGSYLNPGGAQAPGAPGGAPPAQVGAGPQAPPMPPQPPLPPGQAAPQPPQGAPAAMPGGPRPPPIAPPPPTPSVAPARPPAQALQQAAPPNANAPKGMMSTEELAQRIRKANPGIKPDVLVRAMTKAQALLAPEAKTEVALLQIQQKIEMANQRFELGQMSLDNKLQAIQMANQVKIQLQGLKDNALAQKTSSQIDMLLMKLGSQEGIAAGHDASREKIAGGKSRTDTVKMATKAGVSVDPNWSDEELQQKTAAAMDKKFSESTFSDDVAKHLAEAGLKDPSIFSHLGYGQTGNVNRQKVWTEAFKMLDAKGAKPDEIAAARVAIGGKIAEARTIGTQAGGVELATREIDKFAPMVLAASKSDVRTRYPTVNAIMQAAQRGTGGTEIITLQSNIQALKTAYAQLLKRGGKPTDAAQKQASEVIDKAWSDGQIETAIKAIKAEAGGARSAAKEAAGGVAADVAGRSEAAPSEDDNDPAGIR